MIPALYNKSETTFTHNGVGLLSEAVKATVTEERNAAMSFRCNTLLRDAFTPKLQRARL